MAKAQYSVLEELEARITDGTVTLYYEPEFGPGSLENYFSGCEGTPRPLEGCL